MTTSNQSPGERYSKISLLGFMGSGKSSVAPLLAGQLSREHIDLDTLILMRSGFPSIPEMFRALGETAFRDSEAAVARSLAGASGVVIATGGGIIGRPENIEALKNNAGLCILLDASFQEVLRRIPDAAERPLLQDTRKAEVLYNERQPLYRGYADLVVHTDNRSVEEVCLEIISRLD